MKKNTQKILLALYSSEAGVKSKVEMNALKALVPSLSAGGFRSLIYTLRQQDLVTSHRFLGVSFVSITHHGSLLLEREFPALSPRWDSWQGEWSCLVFMTAPSFDKQFRYLRKLLLSQGALPLNRGVYLSPGGFSEVVVKECQASYHNNVLIFSVGEWQIETESSYIINKYGLLDLAETYSGISRDIDRLLKRVDGEKGLMDSQKKQLSLVYDRVVDVLAEDPGFCTFYFKEVEPVRKLVFRLNELIR